MVGEGVRRHRPRRRLAAGRHRLLLDVERGGEAGEPLGLGPIGRGALGGLGLLLDPAHFTKLDGICGTRLEGIQERIYKSTGYRIDPAKRGDVADLIFRKLKLPIRDPKLTKKKTREAVDKDLKLLEPTLTLGLGLLLAFIMWSVLSPVYDILGKLKF